MKKAKLVLAVIGLTLVLIGCFVGSIFIKKYTPSKEHADLTEYFSIEADDECALIKDNELSAEKVTIIKNEYYLPLAFVKEEIDSRFFYDDEEGKLFYTIPTGSYLAKVSEDTYFFDDKKMDWEHGVIIEARNEEVFINLEYVCLITGIEYNKYDDPNRIVMETASRHMEVVIAKKDTEIRFRGGIKSEILRDIKAGDKMYRLNAGEKWDEVVTEDGIRGYVLKKRIKEGEGESIEVSRLKIEERHQEFDGKICMAWHQILSRVGRSEAAAITRNTTGLNVISPTWFYLNDNKGGIASFCSKDYVDYCHSNGIEVWALINNIENKDVDTGAVLKKTSSRETLISALISKAIEFKLDGINVDFESLTSDMGDAYLEFLRELSIKCHDNGLTLSVDNYVPSDYTSFYGRREQARYADYIVVMAYDEHYAGSSEGSVASIGYVENGTVDTLEEVSPKQVIIALPFYTRLWELTPVTTDEGDIISYNIKSSALGMLSAEKKVSENNAKVTYDSNAGQNYAEYEKNGKTYMIWLEDEDSLSLKLETVMKYDVKGVAFWKLGFEKSTTFNMINRYIH